MKLNLALADKSIFVVDDHPINVRLLEATLARAGFIHVRPFTDPAVVVEAVEEQPPDLILLDLNMPPNGGFWVIEQLQEMELEPLPRIIVVSADASDVTRNRAIEAGVDDYVTKPFDRDNLLARIVRVLLHGEASSAQEMPRRAAQG